MRIGHCECAPRQGHEAGRALLKKLYWEETGEELPPIVVGTWGKPRFAAGDWYFSISHTPNHAFCVLAKENVAIDAEELTRRVDLRLGKKILSPVEMAQFSVADDQNRALLTFWVLKEAAAKLSGRGLGGYPRHTDFSLEDPRVRELEGCLVAVMTEEGGLQDDS